MNSADGKVFCIPDGYEVVDKSLEDIKYNLHPNFDEEEIEFMSTRVRYSKALDGTDYIPGCIGLNNIQDSDYQNVIIQMLCTVIPLRNYLLGYQPPSERKPDPVLATIAQLFRKMYNPRNFKGVVSPHEFYQAVGRVTQKKRGDSVIRVTHVSGFYAKQMDPVAFFSWLEGQVAVSISPTLMGYLHRKTKDKKGHSLLHDVFQGEVQVKLCPAHEESRITESKEKTMFMTLELPDEPLFKDNLDFIPQVPLFNLLEKFNGEKPFEKIAKGGESREIRRHELMTSKYTVDLVDRHVAAIRKLCKVCCNGFLLQHLEPLVDLLYLAVDRFAQGQDLLAQALCDFTRVASQPFVSCKTSDMITYGHHLPAFVKGIVSVLSYTSPPSDNPPADPEAKAQWEHKKTMSERLRIEVAHTLACWARFGLDEESVELLPNQPLIQAVADSGTPNLRILRQSNVMDAVSASFRSEDSPESIVITLGAIRDMSLYRPLACQITNCGLISNLVHVIRVNLLGSDVLLVAAEVLWNVLELDWDGATEALGQEEVIESFRDFMYAVLTRGYRFKDKIFRNDMMVLLMYISKRVENRSLFASTGLMSLLLSYAVSAARRKELQASGILEEQQDAKLLPDLGDDGLKKGGIPIVNTQEDMEFRTLIWGTLARCCSSDDCARLAVKCDLVQSLLECLNPEPPVEQQKWSQEQRRKVQKKSLHLLQVAVRMGQAFAEKLGQLGAVGTLVELFTDKDNPMTSRQMCECPANAREFRKKDGVEAMRDEVIYRPGDTTDNHLFYSLCVVDCIWNAVVGTRKNEIRFLDAGGLFALLDCLEVAPMILKRQIIGCLADLMDSRGGQSVQSSPSANRTTVTKGFERASATAQEHQGSRWLKNDGGEQDSRAKIYSVLKCIGFECQETLSIAERQQMELVKLYPMAVELEMWIKVQESLASRGIKPVSADRQWITDSVSERKDQAAWVQSLQRQLAAERQREEEAGLDRFYKDLRGRAQIQRVTPPNGYPDDPLEGRGDEWSDEWYSLRRLPPYVICVVKRFRNNNFFVEKNPTIVTFPLKGLDLRDYIHPDCQPANPETKYDLVANVCHDGKPERGTYKVQVFHQPTSQWFEIHDLRVTPVLPQMVALTESYIQVYQRQDVKPDGSFGKFDAEIPELLAEADPGVAAEIEMAPEARLWMKKELGC
ncbi:unnamed protein product [Durusdinium trenchii]|uniref:USP domain-containing protein n=1 Tax=Durusdinium trenchii TaxID=1381693 RepID=A0ABP0K0L0_9DINO